MYTRALVITGQKLDSILHFWLWMNWLGLFQRFTLPACTLLSYLTVPRPTVVLYSTHGNTAYAGRNEALRCEANLLGGVTVNDVRVSFTWMKNNSVIYAVFNRVKVPQTTVNGTELQSELVFSPLSSSLDNGTYTCVVNLIPRDQMFAMGAIGSNVTELLVASELVHYYSCYIYIYIYIYIYHFLPLLSVSHFHIITTPWNLS